ncbi:hypothetical protein FI667_g15830, partial [Globisporangium splendens]
MLPVSIFAAPWSASPLNTNKKNGAVPMAAYPFPSSSSRVLALSPAKTPAEKSERPGVKLVIGAGITLGYEFALGHYLEFIKIMKQTRPGESYLQLTKEIMHSKGVIGIWDGFFPWGAVQGVAKGSVFAWGHAFTRKHLQPFVEREKLSKGSAEVIAGGIGGGFQGFALSPTLLLKTRVMTDPVFRQQMTPLETCKQSMQVGMKVIRNEGVLALMKGSTVFSLKRVADWSTRFFFSVQSENFLYKRENPNAVLTTNQKMAASLLGGVFSTLVTLPIDVMVAQIQQASKAGAKVSVIDTFRDEFKRGGIKQVAGFATTGFIVRVAHVCFTTMIMKTATSVIYDVYERRQ